MRTPELTQLGKTLVIVILAAIPLLAHAADEQSGALLDRIIAVADEGVVLQSELDSQVQTISQQLRASGTELPPAEILQEQVLESLIIKNLQLQLAKRAGIIISDAQLNAALEQIASRNKTTLSELPAQLAAEGIDYFDFREEMRNELALNQLRQREIVSRIEITPLEVEQMLESSGQAQDQDFNLSHILIAVTSGASESEVSDAQKRAAELVERIKNGEDFGRLAVAYSNGQQALNGGGLGWRKGRELPTLFTEQVGKMEAGEVSPPMRSSSGFHIIRLNDQRSEDPVYEEQTNARHILIMPNELISDEDAKEKLAGIREKIENGEDFADLARRESNDPGSAPRGGELGWNGPNAFVPEFHAALARLEPGQLSEPFQTPFGWHIIQLLDRKQRDTSANTRKNQAYMAIRARKAEEEMQVFVRRLRDEAYVDIRL